MFAHISSKEEYLKQVESKPEIRNISISHLANHDVLISSYIIADQTTFENAYALEARGITFVDGVIACRPLHKFFNVNEIPRTQSYLLPWNEVSRVMIKADGSTVSPVKIGSNILMKSKKSFESDTAKRATAFANKHENIVALNKFCIQNGITPIYEYIDLLNQIVITYQKEDLVLLHVRDNQTGMYWTREQVQDLAQKYNVSLIEDIDPNSFDIQTYLDKALTLEGIEGWVIQFKNGDMVKLKTEWYRKKHRVLTFYRERDIAELVLDEQLDDLKSVLMERNIDMTAILAIEHQVCTELAHFMNFIEVESEKVAKLHLTSDRLIYEYVSSLKFNHEYIPDKTLQSMILANLKGKVLDYVKRYKEFRLRSFSLNQLNNIMLSDTDE